MTHSSDIPMEVLAEGTYFRFLRQGRWESIQPKCFSDVVLIVPLLEEERIVLIEQYRIPVAGPVIELPAGLVGDETHFQGESIEAAARRELIEETGYEADRIDILSQGPPSPGSNSVVVTILLARDLRKVGPGGGDASEEIRVHEVSLADLDAWLTARRAEGAVVDLKLYAGLYLLDVHRRREAP
jgi:ADP-ribose pyrophosphatase